MKRLWFILITLIMVLRVGDAWGGDTYYVRPSGTCANNGTGLAYACAESPGGAGAWNVLSSISTANGVGAGDTVYIDGDFTGEVTGTISAGGSDGSPIVVTAYNSGDKPIIDGRYDLVETGWTDDGDGCYHKAGYTISPHIFLEGTTEEDGVALKVAANSTCSGWSGVNWFYDKDTDTIYYKPTSGTPASHTLKGIKYRWFSHDNDLSYIEISNLHIKYYGFGFRARGSASGCANMQHLYLTNNTFESCRIASYVYPNGGCTASDIIFSNNVGNYCGLGTVTASDAYGPDQISDVVATNNVFTYGGLVNSLSGEWPDRTDDTEYLAGFNSDQEQISMANVDGAVVSGNDISGRTRGIVLYNDNGMYTRNIDIYQNNIHDCTYTGIWSASTVLNVLDNHYTDINIFSNKFNNNGNGEGTDEGTYSETQRGAIHLAGNYVGDSAIVRVSNNDFISCYRGVRLSGIYADNVTMENNIFYDSTKFHVGKDAGQTDITIDYNLYYHTGSCSGDTCWYDAAYVSFSTWDDTYDGNGIEGSDPLFVSVTGGNFRLRPLSPGIDAGTPMAGIHVYGTWSDYSGNNLIMGRGVDCGALEYHSEVSDIIEAIVNFIPCSSINPNCYAQ